MIWSITKSFEIHSIKLISKTLHLVDEIAEVIKLNYNPEQRLINKKYKNNGLIMKKYGLYFKKFPIDLDKHNLEIKISYSEKYMGEEFIENIKIGEVQICKLFIKKYQILFSKKIKRN